MIHKKKTPRLTKLNLFTIHVSLDRVYRLEKVVYVYFFLYASIYFYLFHLILSGKKVNILPDLKQCTVYTPCHSFPHWFISNWISGNYFASSTTPKWFHLPFNIQCSHFCLVLSHILPMRYFELLLTPSNFSLKHAYPLLTLYYEVLSIRIWGAHVLVYRKKWPLIFGSL